MKKKPIKPIIFIQDFGVYTNELLVGVGVTQKRVISFAIKNKFNKKFIEWIKSDEDIFKTKENKNKGLFCWNDNVSGTLLLLDPLEDTWDYWEVLMHEVHHVINHFVPEKMMEREIEAQAYLFVYLFHSIRRKLQGIIKR